MISDVVLDTKIVHTMNGHSSVEGVMDSIVSHVRGMHCSNHMEVNGVASKDEGLAYVVEFNVVNTGGGSLIAWGVHNDDCTVLFVG